LKEVENILHAHGIAYLSAAKSAAFDFFINFSATDVVDFRELANAESPLAGMASLFPF
jgi:hypothetical protein